MSDWYKLRTAKGISEEELHTISEAILAMASDPGIGLIALDGWRDEVAYRAVDSTEIEPPHTDEHPFCQDWRCPCHQNANLYLEYVTGPWADGLLTWIEGDRLFYGEQI